ncbi:MAG: matrixin family metalloprotease [Vulcanimicrobiota bacterium]
MRWSKSIILTLVFLLALPAFAQPSLSDLFQIGQALQSRRGSSDLENALRLGGVIIQMSSRGSYQERVPYNRYPHQPRYPDLRVPTPAPQPPQHPATVSGRPAGYEYIAVGGKTTRLDPSYLPLTINPGDQYHYQTVEKAVEIWNNAGMGALFQVTSGPADLTVDWSGRSVTPGTRAETRLHTSRNVVVPSSISVRTEGRDRYELARVMTHELGHVLGLDHSQHRGDMMYRSEQQGELALSNRDIQMLHWLYSQPDYVPVVGATNTRAALNSYSLNSFNCEGHEH